MVVNIYKSHTYYNMQDNVIYPAGYNCTIVQGSKFKSTARHNGGRPDVGAGTLQIENSQDFNLQDGSRIRIGNVHFIVGQSNEVADNDNDNDNNIINLSANTIYTVVDQEIDQLGINRQFELDQNVVFERDTNIKIAAGVTLFLADNQNASFDTKQIIDAVWI